MVGTPLSPALIHLNSYPGVGKLTIARLLAGRFGAKLLDNHSIYNVAFALTEVKSDAYYGAVRAVRDVAYDLVRTLPPEVPVILTNAHAADSAWGNACWDEAIALARETGRAHAVILLDCSRAENARRIQSEGRDAQRKPRQPTLFRQAPTDRPLIARGADCLFQIDVTALSAAEAAAAMGDWLETTLRPR